MMHGLPGTGKSFFAEKIAKNSPNAIILKTVSFRRAHGKGAELFDETSPQTQEDKDNSYKAVCEEARKAVKAGKVPILDATFHKRYRREWVYNLAKELNERVVVISMTCDENAIKKRLQERKTTNDKDAFLKSVEAYKIMKDQADNLNEKGIIVKIIDTSKDNFNEVLEWLTHIS
jgi:predicted kinase